MQFKRSTKGFCFLVGIILLLSPVGAGQAIQAAHPATSFCLFKNPLCFYNMDVLRYMQVLHQKQEYEQVTKFFYGPLKEKFTERQLANSLSNVDFGYDLKRVGIKEQPTKHWSLTYQRIILGTKENFKIEAALVNDTCRVYLDEATWVQLFEQKPF
jgi:hypothetical protein